MKRIAVYGLIVLMSSIVSCNEFLDSRVKDGDFLKPLLHNNTAGFPLNGDPQVYLGDILSPGELAGASVTLEDRSGNQVPGTPLLEVLDMIASFIPDHALVPDTEYFLIVTTVKGTYVYHFTTRSGAGIAPVVTITGVAEGDSVPLAGSTVWGMLKVTASAADDLGLSGDVVALMGGSTTGARSKQPFTFYLNTTQLPNGPAMIEVRAFDSEGLMGSDTVSVTIDNPAPPVQSWIFDGATDYGFTPSPAMLAGLTAMNFIHLIALDDMTYTDANNNAYLLGSYDLYSGYSRGIHFAGSGVLTVSILNFVSGAFNLPASSFDLIFPDGSVLTAYLPAVPFTAFNQRAFFYVTADGSTYWARYSTGCTGTVSSLGPNTSPSAAFACPAAAAPPP